MKNSFLKGALWLTICALIGKVIGAFYRIPFSMIAGAEGVGLYQLVYPLYALMLTFSTSGLPSSISKLLSNSYAKNDYYLAKKYFKTSMTIIVILSAVSSVIIACFSMVIAKMQGNIDATYCYLAISPAVFFAGLVAGFRGYFQAKENMVPSAISSLIEQALKVAVGLVLAYLLRHLGVVWSTMGVLFGVTASEVVSFVYMYVLYMRDNTFKNLETSNINYSKKKIVSSVLAVSIPIAIGGLIMPITMMIDSVLIVRILSRTFSVGYSTNLFGLQSGVVGSLCNLPVVASIAVQTAILPKLTREQTSDKQATSSTISSAFMFVLIVALPVAVCYYIYSHQIIYFLYGKTFTLEQIDICARLIRYGAFNIIALSLAQASAGVLQGLGKIKTPVITLAISAIIKIISVIILVPMSNINIYGAEISDIICYGFAAMLNIVIIVKNVKFSFYKNMVKILLTSFFVGVIAVFSNFVLRKLVSANFSFLISGGIVAIIYSLILIGVIKDIKQEYNGKIVVNKS